MADMHLLAPDNQNQVCPDMTFWSCDSTGTSMAAHDANGIMNGSISFVRSGQLK